MASNALEQHRRSAHSRMATRAQSSPCVLPFSSATARALFNREGPTAIGCMPLANMLGAVREQLQVLNSIVVTDAVSVVDHFGWLKQSSKMLFHYQSMFKHIRTCFLGVGVARCVDFDIASTQNDTPLGFSETTGTKTSGSIYTQSSQEFECSSKTEAECFSARLDRCAFFVHCLHVLGNVGALSSHGVVIARNRTIATCGATVWRELDRTKFACISRIHVYIIPLGSPI